MKFRVLILFILFTNNIQGQKLVSVTDVIFITEMTNVDNRNIKNILPSTMPNRLSVIDINFSPEPYRIFEDGENAFAG